MSIKNCFQCATAKILAAIILLVAVDNAFAINPPSPTVIGGSFSLDNIPLSRHRYIVLNGEKAEAAVNLLKENDFYELAPADINLFLNKQEYSQEKILSMEIEDVNAYIEYCEKLYSQFPDKTKYLSYSNAHKLYLNYLLGIKLPLRGYLIKAKAYSKETGGFKISLSSGVLKVHHGSLSKEINQYESVYFLVFVETEIKSVTISVNVNS